VLTPAHCAPPPPRPRSTFLECFGPTSQHALPPVLQAFLTDLQAQLLDGPVLATGSVFFQLVAPPAGNSARVCAGGRGALAPAGCTCVRHTRCSGGVLTTACCCCLPCAGHSAAPLGDSSLPERLVAAYAGQVIQHAQLVAWHLQQQQQQQQQEEAAAATPELLLPADFATQCAWLVDCVVLHHLGLCFGVPACAVVACGVYLAAKVLRPGAISFAALTQVWCWRGGGEGCPPQALKLRSTLLAFARPSCCPSAGHVSLPAATPPGPDG
jgi:hypothetical protein